MRPRLNALFSIVVTVAVLTSTGAVADNIGVNTTLIGQVRENENSQKEVPDNTYFGATYSRPKWNLTSETDMRFFRDWKQSLDDYDLYQAVIHLRPNDLIQIDFGRQFLSQGFSTDLADSIKFTFRPTWPVEFTAYTGVPRTVERGDFNNDGLLTGLSVRIKDIPRTHLQVHTAWRKANLRFTDARANDEVLIGADASHLFKGSWKPLVYTLGELNATGKTVDTASLGLDIYPISWAAFNTEINYYNVDRNFIRQSILELLAEGRILSARIGASFTIIPDYLELKESYSYQNIVVNNGNKRNGHLLEYTFPVTLDKIGLDFGPGYYFAHSFGGDLHGIRLSAHEQFTDKLYAEVGVDFTTYDKVTGDNDNAVSAILWSGYEIAKDLILSAGFEVNNNNLFERDVRGSFELQYNYDFDI